MNGVGGAWWRSAAFFGLDDVVGGGLDACAQSGQLLLERAYLPGYRFVAAVLRAQLGEAALGVGEGRGLLYVAVDKGLGLWRAQLRRVGADAPVT